MTWIGDFFRISERGTCEPTNIRTQMANGGEKNDDLPWDPIRQINHHQNKSKFMMTSPTFFHFFQET